MRRHALCSYEPCSRGGRIVYGEPVDLGGCVNRTLRCTVCGRDGEESWTSAAWAARLAKGERQQGTLFGEGRA